MVAFNNYSSFDLVKKMQKALGDAIDSQGGKKADLMEFFKFYHCSNINQCAEGFCYLRESGRIDASKMLVRPVIESMFKLVAVHKNSAIFFRIAYSEYIEEKKWFNNPSNPMSKTNLDLLTQQWEEFKKLFQKQFPSHSINETECSTYQAAEVAESIDFYNSHYRMYCKFTHGAFRAISGGMRSFDDFDNTTMISCILGALEYLISAEASIPNFDEIKQEALNLCTN